MFTSIHRTALIALTVLAIPFGAAAQDTQALNVTELQCGTAIEGGVVASPQTSFSRTDGRIFAVVRVQNPTRTATNIRVSLEHAEGPERPGMSLDIPARRRWRTVARFGASHPPGAYRIVVRNAEGAILSSQDITITE